MENLKYMNINANFILNYSIIIYFIENFFDAFIEGIRFMNNNLNLLRFFSVH